MVVMRAAIDIGSNSVLLLVGRRDAAGQVVVAAEAARITRLARGASATGALDPAAIDRTVAVLAEYREIAAQHGGQIVAVATEGLRVAKDPSVFLNAAKEALGVDVRMISGDEEARLSYLSVAHEKPAEEPVGPLRVVDIGGASTELVVGQGREIVDARSHHVGSVRFTERFVDSDVVSSEAIAAIDAAASEALQSQPVTPHPEVHGLAGTVTTAAALLLDLAAYDRLAIDGSRWSAEQLVSLRDRLAALPLEQRIREPVLPRGRADVIVAGLTILIAVLRHCGASTLVTRDRGLRYALI